MATPTQAKQQSISLLDALPVDHMEELMNCVDFLHNKPRLHQPPSYAPVTLGNIWSGVDVDEVEIFEARRTIWGLIGEHGRCPALCPPAYAYALHCYLKGNLKRSMRASAVFQSSDAGEYQIVILRKHAGQARLLGGE